MRIYKNLNVALILSLGLAVAEQTATAQNGAPPTLILTEVSDTLLDWKWSDGTGGVNGGSLTAVITGSSQAWDLSTLPYPASLISLDSFNGEWAEPNPAEGVNSFNGYFSGAGLLGDLLSDIPGSGGPVAANGGVISSTLGSYSIQVIDQGDQSSRTVPEACSSLYLMTAAAGGLLGLRRFVK
jgi:hypothetical protein